jgi:hypothetical protein
MKLNSLFTPLLIILVFLPSLVFSDLKTKDSGEWDLGIFIVDDESAIDSDTIALSLRGTYETQSNPHLL